MRRCVVLLAAALGADLLSQEIAALRKAIAAAQQRVKELRSSSTTAALPDVFADLPELSPCIDCPPRAAEDFSLAYEAEQRGTGAAWSEDLPVVLRGNVAYGPGEKELAVDDATMLSASQSAVVVGSALWVAGAGPRGAFKYEAETKIGALLATNAHVLVAERQSVHVLYMNGTTRVKLETGQVDGLTGASSLAIAWSEQGNVTLIDATFAPRVLRECVGQLPRSPLRAAAVRKRDLLLATDEEVLRFALPSCILLARNRHPGVESLMAGSGVYAVIRRRGEAFLRALEPNLQPLWQRPLGREKCGAAIQMTVALDRILVACGRSRIVEVPRLFTAAEVENEPESWAEYILQYASYVAGAIGLFVFYKYIRRSPPPTPEEMAEMMEALRTDSDGMPEDRQQNQRDFATSEKPGVKQLFSQLPKNLKDELRTVLEKQQVRAR